MLRRTAHRRVGFTLIELLVVIAIIALLIGILLPALGEARRSARLAIDLSNLKQMATATQSYSADFEDRIWGFTWRINEWDPNTFDDLKGPYNRDVDAAARQAVSIIRKRADRDDMPLITNWIPHVLYSHLTLQDYLASRLPEQMVVCPENKHRLNWQIDPRNNFDKGAWAPYQPGHFQASNRRWPYSSSYIPTVAAYDKLASYNIMQGDNQRVRNATSHNFYYVNSTGDTLGNLKMADVRYPGSKAHLYERAQRHFTKRELFFTYPDAKVTMNFFDGSAGVRSNEFANLGWDPWAPAAESFVVNYVPQRWEPPTKNGQPSILLEQVYNYTRGGLNGVDFGGDPLNTGQPQP